MAKFIDISKSVKLMRLADGMSNISDSEIHELLCEMEQNNALLVQTTERIVMTFGRAQKATSPPGDRLLSALRRVAVPERAIERVFKPMLADFRYEHGHLTESRNFVRIIVARARLATMLSLTLVRFLVSSALRRVFRTS
jgi:hypothetical protein